MKKKDLLIGCHLSISGGISRSVERAKDIGCTAFQIFTSNPRGWSKNELSQEEITRFREGIKETGIFPIAHMPYLPNLAAPDKEIYKKSVEQLIIELERCESLGITYIVTHLGSHLGTGEEEGRKRIVDAIRIAISKANSSTMILLENTAGTRNSLGSAPNDLARIISELNGDKRIGVCIDTAHAFAAGYDWREPENKFYSEINEVKLKSRIKVLHFNDSKVDLNGKADRHEHIGLGKIGLSGLALILKNSLFQNIPIILETPVDDRRDDKSNLDAAKKLVNE